MKKCLLLLSLSLYTSITHSSPSGWLENVVQDMQKRMHEMQDEFNRVREVFSQSLSTDQASVPILSSEIIYTDNGEQRIIKNVEPGDISAEFSDDMVTIKHPQFTICIKKNEAQRLSNMIMLRLDTRKKESLHGDSHNAETFYCSSHTEGINLKRPVDLERTELIYDTEKKELAIKLLHKMGKQIPITVASAVSSLEH